MQVLGRALNELASGNLAVRLTDMLPEKNEAARQDFNRSTGALDGVMTTIVQTVGDLSNVVEEVSSASEDLSRRTEQQAHALEETASALHQLTTAVRKPPTVR